MEEIKEMGRRKEISVQLRKKKGEIENVIGLNQLK
jgi:hypothetical protein